MATNKQTDPIFAACAKSAPRLDLAFYLLAAGRTNPDRFGENTPIVIGRMADIYREITGPKPGPTGAQKRRVWQVIGQYKDSIPCYFHGDAGPVVDDDPEPAEPIWWPTALDDAAIVRLATETAVLATLRRRLAVPTLDVAELPAMETLLESAEDGARTAAEPAADVPSLPDAAPFLAPAEPERPHFESWADAAEFYGS